MAKKKERPEIEDAVIVEEEIQETTLEASLPEIPTKFIVEGKEYSLAVVKDLETRAEKLISKATPGTYEDKKLWEKVFDLKQEAVKMRTILESKRKELIKPVNEFLTNLKSKTDGIGNSAKEIQSKLEDILNKKENWEEEKRKEEEAKLLKRTNERIEVLIELKASCDPIRGTYSFVFDSGSTVVNKIQIEEFDDDDFNDLITELKQDIETQKEADKKAKEEAEKEAQELKDKQDKLIEKQLKLRTKELNMMDAGFVNGCWAVNGIYFSPEEMRDLDDDAWEAKIEQAEQGVPDKEETSSNEPLSPVSDTDIPEKEESPVGASSDPLGEVIAESVESHNEHQKEVDGIVETILTFSKDNPYIDYHLAGKSRQRIFPADYEEEALKDIHLDSVVSSGQVGEEDLLYCVYKMPN